MRRRPITSDAYAAGGGTSCPACGSSDTTGQSVHVESGAAYQGVTCDVCDASWTDSYTLDGYRELHVPDAPATLGNLAAILEGMLEEGVDPDARVVMRLYPAEPSRHIGAPDTAEIDAAWVNKGEGVVYLDAEGA